MTADTISLSYKFHSDRKIIQNTEEDKYGEICLAADVYMSAA
jgi:hypothetical protein